MPRSSREKTAETHSRIVDAAHRCFVEQGYNGTSMRDISREAGLTLGAIYNHFSNKEDLWVAVLWEKHPYQEIRPLIQSIDAKTFPEFAKGIAGGMIEILSRRPDLFSLMFTEIVEFKSKHVPSLYQRITPEVFAGLNTPVIQEGKLRDIPLGTLMRSFVGLFFSYYATGMLLQGLGGVAIEPESLNQFVEIYLYGALADDDPSRLRHAEDGWPFDASSTEKP